MGGSFRYSAVPGADLLVAARGTSTLSLKRSHLLPRRLILTLLLLAGALLISAAPALASGEVEHIFGKSFKAAGTKCAFTEPGGVAVNEASTGEGAGDVFVYDRATNAIDVFTSTGTCVLHHTFGTSRTGSATSEGIAVDNSTGPSAGAVYVVEGEKHAIYKFKLKEGKFPPARTIIKFKKKEKEAEEHEFEPEIHGIGVDASGNLWVDNGEVIDQFSGSEPNTFLSIVEDSGSCLPKHGFAVASSAVTKEAEFFYVGRERENRLGACEEATVLVKINTTGEAATEPPGEPARKAQLDNENTTGVAVDSSNDVYFDNGTSVSEFNAKGLFVQRFGDEAGAGQLLEGAGVAINSATNDAFVAEVNAGAGDVKLYEPKTSKEPTGEPTHELPDHRAYEMVSPPIKFGAALKAIGLNGDGGFVQASEDGSAITYSASGPVVANPPANRSPEPESILSRRGSQSWSTESIATPRNNIPVGWKGGEGAEYRFFSSDLSTGLVDPALGVSNEQHELALSPEATETTLYSRSLTTPSSACEPTPSTCYQALVSPLNDTAPAKPAFGSKLHIASATPDARHAVFKSEAALTPEATEEEGLYEWETGGTLKLVSAFPTGEAGTAAEARLGGRGEQFGGIMRHAISNDGSLVIWSASVGAEEPERLYLRDTATKETIRIDSPEAGVTPPVEAGASFQTASADGSKIFFTDNQKLTKDATEEGEEGAGEGLGDLYVCEVTHEGGKAACKLKDLTAGVKAANENAAVQGVIGASEEGSYVYFVADGVLAGNAGRGQCTPRSKTEEEQEQEGKLPVQKCSLYVEHNNGAGWETPKLIATLTSEDAPTWHTIVEGGGALAAMASRVSPKGHYLAFMSNSSLTGYNNVDTHPEAKGARDEEVFLYSTATGRVTCASCNPSGAQPSGIFDTEKVGEGLGLVIDRTENWKHRWLAANIPGWTGRSIEAALYQSRYLSDTGRLFFNSVDGLVPADTNEKADVYEFEQNGEGTCTSPTGCVSLISTGTSKQESAFLDASETGGDVFMLTASQLVPQDRDTAFDVYDARVCTSESPCLTPPVETHTACEEKPSEATCKPASATQPALPSAPPSSLPGTGNAGTHEVLGLTVSKPAPVVKPLTRAQKLAKALKACKKLKKKSKRASCIRQANKKYGPIKKGKAVTKKGKK
jgi:hypothetical protein